MAPAPQVHYKVAEVFDSIQGEGQWTGHPMRFIRLAGCNVGTQLEGNGGVVQLGSRVESALVLSNTYPNHTICHLWNGKLMLCDTDYRCHHTATISDLLQGLKETQHICITGGEPFLHNIGPLVLEAQQRGLYVHIETSGTRPMSLPPTVSTFGLWITCSPKARVIWEEVAKADEIKLLVYPETTLEHIYGWLRELAAVVSGGDIDMVLDLMPIYLQPITNQVDEIDRASLKQALYLIKQDKRFCLSAQLHKYIGVL